MSTFVKGPLKWNMVRDAEGHREYKISFLVISDDPEDGPAIVLDTPGLPVIGSVWAFGNDADPWAWCRANVTISPVLTKEPNRHWEAEYTFSTKPPENDKRRCQDTKIEDPLLEPQKVSGGLIKYTEERARDRFGNPIKNSAHEQLRGPQVEFDANRPTITIEQNVPALELALCTSMRDTVNDDTLWGLPRRTIKLSDFTWERKFYGSCSVYYTRRFTFDVNFSTFDRDVLDEGTKALHGENKGGEWVIKPFFNPNYPTLPIHPDRDNPQHFVRYKDSHGENTRILLDGGGLPVDPTPGSGSGSGGQTAGTIHIEAYGESNFLLLNIPVDF